MRTHEGKELVRWAKARGWSCTMTQKGHARFTKPDVPMPIFTGLDLTDWRSLKNAKAQLIRAERQCGS